MVQTRKFFARFHFGFGGEIRLEDFHYFRYLQCKTLGLQLGFSTTLLVLHPFCARSSGVTLMRKRLAFLFWMLLCLEPKKKKKILIFLRVRKLFPEAPADVSPYSWPEPDLKVQLYSLACQGWDLLPLPYVGKGIMVE